jgi:hypothetical protein
MTCAESGWRSSVADTVDYRYAFGADAETCSTRSVPVNMQAKHLHRDDSAENLPMFASGFHFG